jgi:small conductance mechanosensitive channel
LKAQLTDAADHKLAIKMLKERVSAITNVLKDPPPDVAIMEFNGTGPLLLVRPYCNNAHYWQVHADTNQVIKETMIDGNFPGPVQEVILHNRS